MIGSRAKAFQMLRDTSGYGYAHKSDQVRGSGLVDRRAASRSAQVGKCKSEQVSHWELKVQDRELNYVGIGKQN